MLLKAKYNHNQNDQSDIWLYELDHSSVNIFGLKINGRYPKEDWLIDNESDMIFMVLEGEMAFIEKDASTSLRVGDSYHLKKNCEYRIESYSDEGVKFWVVTCPPSEKLLGV
jgi:mannose-6-phosphate isomerase-like protein (cupin superfamily)